MSFDDKVVWITGASSGIGEALALAAAERSARLVLSARREEELQRVRAACERPGDHLVLPLDLAEADGMPAMAARVLDHFGRVDVLVNNGGMTQRSLVAETELAVIRRLVEVNFFGAVALTKAVLPSMLERGSGHIVAVSSLAGKFGTPLRCGYAAAKHALHGFFDCLRAEVYEQGLRVTLVCPGFVRTKVSLNAVAGDGSKHAVMDPAVNRGVPPERAAAIILRAIEREQDEVLFGGKELMMAHLKRLSPSLLNRVIRRMKVT